MSTVVNADACKQIVQLDEVDIGLYCLCNRYNTVFCADFSICFFAQQIHNN